MAVPQNEVRPAIQAAVAQPRVNLARAGLCFLALSVVLWIPLPFVPFLPLSGADRAALGGALVVGAEVAFWVGAVLAGPEVARRMRSWPRRALAKLRPGSSPPA